MKKILTLIFISALAISCSHPQEKKIATDEVPSYHGGEVLKGDGYYLEVVGSEDKVEIYPLKRDGRTGKLVAIPLKQIDLEASYSYSYKEKDAGEGKRPTQKGEATIDLHRKGSALVGEVNAEDVAAYSLVIKADYKNEEERFVYKVDL